ncbi:MAG TPA: hypothetical protein DEP35_04315 [Deltaproteobacteria bacterium]|nr:hypothetical protein [Deltaproteobacteria bacterium]
MSPLELVYRLELQAAQAVAAFDAVRSAPGNVLPSSALSLGEAWRSRCIALYRLSWARLALSEVPRHNA